VFGSIHVVPPQGVDFMGIEETDGIVSTEASRTCCVPAGTLSYWRWKKGLAFKPRKVI
jgi:hypothetical protein